MKAQLLKKDGKPEFAVLPIAEYRKLLQRLEELEDVRDFRDYKRNPADSFPAEVVNRLLDGDNPVRVWREYRSGKVIYQVAVGMPVTRHPPHRSRRAELPHRAPASGQTQRR